MGLKLQSTRRLAPDPGLAPGADRDRRAGEGERKLPRGAGQDPVRGAETGRGTGRGARVRRAGDQRRASLQREGARLRAGASLWRATGAEVPRVQRTDTRTE